MKHETRPSIVFENHQKSLILQDYQQRLKSKDTKNPINIDFSFKISAIFPHENEPYFDEFQTLWDRLHSKWRKR